MMKMIVVTGRCWTCQEGCSELNGKKVEEGDPIPPFHEGCVCYLIDKEARGN